MSSNQPVGRSHDGIHRTGGMSSGDFDDIGYIVENRLYRSSSEAIFAICCSGRQQQFALNRNLLERHGLMVRRVQ